MVLLLLGRMRRHFTSCESGSYARAVPTPRVEIVRLPTPRDGLFLNSMLAFTVYSTINSFTIANYR